MDCIFFNCAFADIAATPPPCVGADLKQDSMEMKGMSSYAAFIHR